MAPTKKKLSKGDQDEKPIPEALDGGFGWVIVVAAFLLHLIIDGAAFGYGVVSKHIKEYYGASESEATLVGSLQLGFYLLACPVAGKLVEKFGYRIVCISGSLLAGTGFATAQLSPNIFVLMITYGVVSGTGFGFMYLSCISAVTMYFDKRRVLATGLATCGSGLGMFAFSSICGYLIEQFDWKSAVLIIGGIILNGCVLGALLRPLEDNPKNQRKYKAKKNGEASESLLGDQEKTQENGEVAKDEHLKVKTPSAEESGFVSGGSSPNDPDSHSKEVGNKDGTKTSVDNEDGPKGGHVAPSLNPKIRELRGDKSGYIDSLQSVVSSLQNIEGKQDDHMTKDDESRDTTQPMSGCMRCVSAIVDTSLLREPIFYIICIANIFAFLGAYIPLKFQVDRAMTFPLSPDSSKKQEMADFLVSVSGIASTLGRATSALFDINQNIDKLLLYNLTVLGCGISCFFNYFSTSYALMCVFASIFTFFFGIYIALSSVVTCEMLGPAAVNNAFALMCMLRGFANIAGGPIAGAAYDVLRDYDVCFYIGGTMLTLGGICFCLLHLPYIQKRSFKNKIKQTDTENDYEFEFTSVLHVVAPVDQRSLSRSTQSLNTIGHKHPVTSTSNV